MTQSNNKRILIPDARVVLPDGEVVHRSLLLENGIINRISESPISVSSAVTVNVEGLTIVPGFIDVHIHGAQGVDTMTASAEDLYRVSQFLAAQGVTAWLPTLVPGSDEENERAVSAIDSLMATQDLRQPAARALGVHYEGPFVNPEQCGALRKQFFRTYPDKSGQKLLPTPTMQSAVRMMTMAPEIEGGIELAGDFGKRGWVVSIGHTKASFEVLERAREAGARHMTHFMNAMPSLHHRAPGPVGWGLTRDDVTVDVIADGIHINPLVLKFVLKCKTPGRVTLISDSVAPTGLGDGEFRVWDETITVENGRTKNERGSIAGSVISLSDAVQLIRSLGVTEADIVKLTSANAAKLLRIDDSYGSVMEGKRADLVGIDNLGKVRVTMVDGGIAYDGRSDK